MVRERPRPVCFRAINTNPIPSSKRPTELGSGVATAAVEKVKLPLSWMLFGITKEAAKPVSTWSPVVKSVMINITSVPPLLAPVSSRFDHL